MPTLSQASWFGKRVEDKFPELGNLWQWFETISEFEYKRYQALYYQNPEQLKRELEKVK